MSEVVNGTFDASTPDIEAIDRLAVAIREGRWISYLQQGGYYDSFRAAHCEIDIQYPRIVGDARSSMGHQSGGTAKLHATLYDTEYVHSLRMPEGSYDTSSILLYDALYTAEKPSGSVDRSTVQGV